jgi:radical SAM protein (TIGR01212 family)
VETKQKSAIVPIYPYYRYSDFLKKRFGGRVQKITVDGGFSCPNRDGTLSKQGCVYCNNEAFSPARQKRHLDIQQQVMDEIEKLQKKGVQKYLVYFQPFTNTHEPVRELENIYNQALCHPGIVGLAIGTRPDCIDPDRVSLINDIAKDHYVSLEIGVQSIHEKTLKWMNRGHDFRAVCRAADLCQKTDAEICFHVILGLPGEGDKEVNETAASLAKLGYHSLKIHNLHVLKGTRLEQDYHSGRIAVTDMDTHVERTVDFLERTPGSISIQRLMGDAPRKYLVAPAWCLEKQKVLKAIDETFMKRGSVQGRYTENPYSHMGNGKGQDAGLGGR